MRTLFIALVVIHGLVHIIGFLRAFRLLAPKGYSVDVSKPFGFLWLTAFIVFELTALMMVYDYQLWWVIGLIGVILSQWVIIYSWHDNKYGTFVNILILFVIVIDYGSWNFSKRFVTGIHNEIRATDSIGDTLVTYNGHE